MNGKVDGRASSTTRLTKCQREVLELVVQGLSSPEIAKRLHRGARTVESHRLALGKKLGARNRVELVRRAVEEGLVSLAGTTAGVTDAAIATGLRGHISANESAERVLHFIDAGTSATTGDAFFRALVSHLTLAFKAHGAFVARCLPSGALQSIAVWGRRGPLPGFELPMQQSPCAGLQRAEVVALPADDCVTFPPNPDLIGRQLLVTALFDSRDARSGTLGLIHDGDLDQSLLPETILRLFAGRAASELERITADAELRRSNGLLAASQTLAKLGSWTCLGKSEETIWSDEMFRLFDLHPGEARPSLSYFLSRMHPDDRARILAGPAPWDQADSAFELEFRIQRPDGSWRHLHSWGRTPPREERNTTPVVVAFQDLTHRKATEDALKHSRALLEAILNSLPAGIALLGPDGRIRMSNQAWRECAAQFGLSADGADYYPDACRRVFGQAAGDDIELGMRAVLTGDRDGYTREVEWTLQSQIRRCNVQILPARNAVPGAVVRHLDTTQQLELELALSQGRERLELGIRERTRDLEIAIADLRVQIERRERVEAEYEHVFQMSRDLLCIVNLAGTIKRANPAFCGLLGRSETELGSAHFLEFCHPDDRARVDAHVNRLRAGYPLDPVAVRMLHADGSVRWIAWASAPPVSDELRPIGRDVTAQKLGEDAVRRAKADLEESFRFLDPPSNVGHG